jgi:membrane protease YdiL (CAAX protease family)
MLFWKRLLLFILGAALCVLVYLFLLNLPGLGRGSFTEGLIPVVVLAAGTGWLTARFLRKDGLPLSALGLTSTNRPLSRLVLGIVAGGALTGIWLVIVTVATGATWHMNPSFSYLVLVGTCVFNFLNNVAEEMVYRGYAFVRLIDRLGPIFTVVATSAVFALLHLQAGLPLLSVLAGVFTTALVFGAMFERWRSLPLALGFHVATNIVQDASGLRAGAASLFMPIYPTRIGGSGTIILGSIAGLNVLLAAGILLVARRPPYAPRQ